MKLYELNDNTSNMCKKKREFGYKPKTTLKNHVIKAKIATKACRDLILGEDRDVVWEEFQEVYEGLYYPTEVSREYELQQAWKEVNRYVEGEMSMKRERLGLEPMLVDIGLSEEVLVEPTYVCLSHNVVEPKTRELLDGCITIVRLHAGKLYNITKAKNNLSLYALLKYARKLVSPGKKAYICVNDIYLKRGDDRSQRSSNPHFSENFWDPNGKNVIAIGEIYHGGQTEDTKLDLLYKPLVENFKEGVEAEDCSESDCATCQLYSLCHYAEPPIQVTKEEVAKSTRDILLTDSQEAAIEHDSGIVRINAGAGVGKTVVVALRTVTLLSKGYKPSEIVLMTFTNAGAEEMRSRIQLYNDEIGTGEDISDMKICTFNSFGDDILREEYEQFGFTEPPKIIDDVERASIISKILKDNIIDGLNYEQFVENSQYLKGAVWIAARVFEIVKKGAFTQDDLQEVYDRLGQDKRFATTHAVFDLINLYDEYDAALREQNLIEFADQEMMLFELLTKDPYYLEKFNFKHIIVDEYQDTNLKQVELLKKFIELPTFESLMVVGDDSQAIFSFRDTSPEYIINFEEHIGHPSEDIFLLENHRCTPQIIDFANKINALNVNRVAKNLIATRPSGKEVVVKGFHSNTSEQEYIIEGVKKHLANNVPPEDIAIICSTKMELKKFADLLTKEGIQSVSLNPEPLLDNSRVEAALSFVLALTNQEDEASLLVYANAKNKGTFFEKEEEDIEKAIQEAREEVEMINNIPSPADQKEALVKVLTSLDFNNDEIYQQFLKTITRKSFEQIIEYCHDFLIFGIKNEARRDHEYPGVVLTTCHSSKGLEWPIVYASISKFDTENKHLHTGSNVARDKIEEQRRLLFVTATRARDELYITGKYVAYGNKKEYTYNMFLREAIVESGQEFSVAKIIREQEEIAKEQKKEREEAKKKAKAKLDELKKK